MMKTFYKILAILLGYGLIIAGFIVFGELLPDDVRVLDIIVTCLMFTQLVEFFFFPLIDTGRPAHKEVGMLGIHLAALNTYFGGAIVVMAAGIYWHLPFSWQLLMQLAALLILVLGRVFTLHAGDKVEQVYQREEQLRDGKAMLKMTMESVVDKAACCRSLSPDLLARLQALQDDIRFVTPSTSTEARSLESRFMRQADTVIALLRALQPDEQRLADEIAQLELLLSKRKSLFN